MKYYLAIKRNEILIHVTTWMSLENYAASKKSNTKGYILYDSVYIKHPEQASL